MLSKKSQPNLLILAGLFLASSAFFVSQNKLYPQLSTDITSGGTTYKSMTPNLGRIDENSSRIDENGETTLSMESVHLTYAPINYSQYQQARFFVPPGTVRASLRYTFSASYDYKFLASFNAFPEGDPNSPPAGCVSGSHFSFDEALGPGIFCGHTNADGLMHILDDWQKGGAGLSVEKGGWFYIKTNYKSTNVFSISPFFVVNVATYNHWWDNYGSNPDGSINWEKDVEGVLEYKAVQNIPGDIEPLNQPDGDVDIFDYSLFLEYWPQSPSNNPADLDQNGKVDIFDYNQLVENFGRGAE